MLFSSARGWNVEADGLFGAPPITVIVGSEVHVSPIKALGMLGLGRSRLIKVPVDNQGRMRADSLPKLSGPTIILTQAGNVNTGAFDPIDEICMIAHLSGAWVHVDGAFGLWAMVTPSMAHLTVGIAKADSWATDFHKWLNVPYDSGLALFAMPMLSRRRWRSPLNIFQLPVHIVIRQTSHLNFRAGRVAWKYGRRYMHWAERESLNLSSVTADKPDDLQKGCNLLVIKC